MNILAAKQALDEKGYLDLDINVQLDLFAEIERLKKEKNAILLAHYYQEPDIQDVADYIGDSLGLAQKAAQTDADIIVFAGVHFMAETAKIVNPTKKVLLPDLKAGCSLADSAPVDQFRAFKAKHPDHLVVSYINCTADIKAESDIICTSSNAKAIIGLRNQVIHAYDNISDENIWSILTNHLPKLSLELNALIAENEK